MNPIRQARDWYARRRLHAELRALAGGGYVPSAPVLSGTFVTPETAIGLTAVYCAINVISRDVATLKRNVYKKLPGGGLEIDESHPAQEILRYQPNSEMGRFRFNQAKMGHVLGRGNGYSEIVRKNGYPVSLELLHPVKTKPKRTPSGTLYYELENKRELLAEDVLHFAGLGFDGISGYSPITVCRQSMGVGIATEQFGASFFGNSAIPRGLLKYPKRLSEAAISNLRRTWNQVHQGSQSAHQLGILEEGADWVNTQISPEDSQFIESRKMTVLEVGRIFSCPPHKLGDYSQAHLANVEESNLDYIGTTILGWVEMLDDECNCKLLTRAERRTHEIITDLRALLRGNTAARTAYYQVMRNLGAMSGDDIRIAESLNPIGPEKGGDKYLVQSQYTPLDQVGKSPPPPPKTTPRSAHQASNGRLSHVLPD